MEINEFKEKKRKMEEEIRNAVCKILSKFKEETNYSPSLIDIQLINTMKIGDEKTEYAIVDVRTQIDI